MTLKLPTNYSSFAGLIKEIAVVLIDVYDTPIQAAYLHAYYDQAILLFRHFLGAGLKDNPYLFRAVLIGILRVSRESLFSGLNNISCYAVIKQRGVKQVLKIGMAFSGKQFAVVHEENTL